MSNAAYKLIYFDRKGRGEVTRILFHSAGQSFEDFHIPLDQWPIWKAKLPFGQAPVLEITENGMTTFIAQSNAIERFLANKFNLFGKDDIERARIDMINEQSVDIFNLLYNIYKKINQNQENKPELEKVLSETVPASLKLIQNLYENNQKETNNSGFLVGSSLTYADIKLVLLYNWLRESRDVVLEHVPHLKEHYQKITNMANMSAQFAKKMKLCNMFPN